ncbi:MAG: aldo/keto reductase [Pseudomonadota bacterium]
MTYRVGRRAFLRLAAAAAISTRSVTLAQSTERISPVPLDWSALRNQQPVGMGTWLTFDVEPTLYDARQAVLEAFVEHGGGMIDSSPMYGRAEKVIGTLLARRPSPTRSVLSATKIWTVAASRGSEQLGTSQALWGQSTLDLVYVHNLLKWRDHLPMLREAKEAGAIRSLGVTTSHGRRHDEMLKVLRSESLDCLQMSYSLANREAERRLLPAAHDRGVTVVINRPFQTGALIQRLAPYPLPEWLTEFGASSWAQVLLQFVLSHPAVTNVIPATRRTDHMHENMAAGRLPALNAATRQRLIRYVESL